MGMGEIVSKIGICNRGIRLAGLREISALTDAQEEARVLNTYYDSLLREVLAAHDWNFARKSKKLTRLGVGPLYRYKYQYQIPAECLAPRYIEDWETFPFEIQANKILADESSVVLVYTVYQPDTMFTLAAFSGSGLNDAEFEGPYTGSTTPVSLKAQIDGVGTGTAGVDTFKWSNTGGSTWNATHVDITGQLQSLIDGMEIRLGATTGHTSGNSWSSTLTSGSTSIYSDLFINALACRIAMLLAYTVTKNSAAFDRYEKKYAGSLNEARSIDSMQSVAASKRVVTGDWMRARL